MKGYRRLAPGEVIREGDTFWAGGIQQWAARTVGRAFGGRHMASEYWRKARTDGAPPGWRWCDGGETCTALLSRYSDRLEECDAIMPHTDDALLAEDLRPVMPYPEDPRLT